MSKRPSEQMRSWLDGDTDARVTTLVVIAPSTIRSWIELAIALESERDALRDQVVELFSQFQEMPDSELPF